MFTNFPKSAPRVDDAWDFLMAPNNLLAIDKYNTKSSGNSYSLC